MGELNEQELERVQLAVKSTSTDLSYLELWRRDVVPGLIHFADSWDALSPDAKSSMQLTVADLAESGAATSVDLGRLARSLVDGLEGKQGERLPAHIMRVATSELFAIWVERGNAPTLGNLSRQRELGLDTYPACNFVAQALRRLFPGELDGDTQMAERRADTHLRALDRAGLLPYRKKSR